MDLSRITTKDIIATLVIGATMIFAGVSQYNGKPVDAATMGLAGAIVMHYFGPKRTETPEPEQPLGEPSLGGEGD